MYIITEYTYITYLNTACMRISVHIYHNNVYAGHINNYIFLFDPVRLFVPISSGFTGANLYQIGNLAQPIRTNFGIGTE